MGKLAWALGLGIFLWGCGGPSLEVPSAGRDSMELIVQPQVDVKAMPLLWRGQLKQAPLAGEPWLIRGELSDYYERAVRRGELLPALRERAVPLRFWRDERDCWLQPLTWLEPDEDYALVFTSVGTLQVLHTSDVEQRVARRLFPPVGSAKHRVAVLCDMDVESPEGLALEPGSVPLALDSGMAGVRLPGCVTLTATRELTTSAVAPPNLSEIVLDPEPWLPPPPIAAPLSCAGERLHGACVEPLDDRVMVTPLGDDQLWLMEGAAPLAARRGERALLAGGLQPESDVTLSGALLSSSGELERLTLAFRTTAARTHLVINEVLANPLGAEATGEWIELYNDAERPVSLAGLWLEDGAGHVALPDVALDPREIVLLVAEGFSPSGADVPVPEAVRRIALTSLGSRGLANGGETLTLVGPDGIISRFPSLPASHAGRSQARRSPDAPDDLSTSFAEHGGRGASPGAPNTFD